MNIALIVAAGNSARCGNVDKLFVDILNKPLLYYTIQAFQSHVRIDEILIVGSAKNINQIAKIKQIYDFNKIVGIIPGGETRQDSVWNGLRKLREWKRNNQSVILVHNGANPLVAVAEIDLVLEAQAQYGNAVVGSPVKDTLKIINRDHFIEQGLKRDQIWAMQTPQSSTLGKLFTAYENLYYPFCNNSTDEAEALELMGEKVKVVRASETNIKVTTPIDIEFCSMLLKQKLLSPRDTPLDVHYHEEGLNYILRQ
jgi:2-C-methyl-D-erythritol 4-phosphate cytidylyltransferase